MELVLKDYPAEVDAGASIASFLNSVESQKNLFHKQIDQLRNIVVSQCKLTGVNPLSQEMAAGALSIRIGKRPRDLLNPKAVKYMQAVFSVKDAISKKESREIGALFGLTVTQVREYFASQRTRVRKIIRVAREKAVITLETKPLLDGESVDADHMPREPVPLNSIGPLTEPVPLNCTDHLTEPVPLKSIGPPTAEEAPSCSNQDELLPGIGEFDKHFVENIFSSMNKEESFSGQVKLMEWILRVENPLVLSWFLSKDGVMILDTWLSQAAIEEQTSVLSVILKVLCHLPLNKALPLHMSVILQGVNRLRFYRIADISNRTRVLLSKWSKMFAKSQALKKLNGTRTYGSQEEIDLSQRLDELMGDGSWHASLDKPDGILVPYVCAEDTRRIESQDNIELLTATPDDSNRKHILGASSTHTKERRKVLLVEQPGQKSSKNVQVKAVSVNQARPITADEIQKAKMRAHLMQNVKTKAEDPKKLSLLTNDFLSASEAYLRPKLEAQKKARLLPPKRIKRVELGNQKPIVDQTPIVDQKPIVNQRPIVDQTPIVDQKPIVNQTPIVDQKPIVNQMPIVEPKESLLDKCQRVLIPWRVPSEVHFHSDWGVGTGENSKEIEVQKNRTRREKETFYSTIHEVPPNPKEPWDTEMEYDDTLTPDIPIDQLLETDISDTPLEPLIPETQSSLAPSGSSSGAEPDLELLAVLLKNPELVFALTSGQASGLSGEDTIKLLDMLKSSGGLALLNGQAGKPEKEVEVSLPSPTPTRDVQVSLPSPTPPSRTEVSLPSPTPSINPGPSGWTTETAKNPFSRQTIPGAATAQFTSSTVIPIMSHLSSRPSISSSRSPYLSENLSAEHTPAFNQNPPTNYHHTKPFNNGSPSAFERFPTYLRSHSEYQVPEDNNLRMTNPSHHDFAHNSFSNTQGSQILYNSSVIMGSGSAGRPEFNRERNEFNAGGQMSNFESWGRENSPTWGMYAPPEQHGHGYSDQMNARGHITPHDRRSMPGFRDHNWQAGGGANRQWNGGERR